MNNYRLIFSLMPEMLEKQSIRNPLAVSLGAIAGSLSRYYLAIWRFELCPLVKFFAY
jgi:hypothetical protein